MWTLGSAPIEIVSAPTGSAMDAPHGFVKKNASRINVSVSVPALTPNAPLFTENIMGGIGNFT